MKKKLTQSQLNIFRTLLNQGMVLHAVLNYIVPGASWSCGGSTLEHVEWDESNTAPKPTQEEYDKGAAELVELVEAAEYSVVRRGNYPAIAEQLDMLWHAMDSGEIPKAKKWYSSIKKIKDEIPKP